jgi:hypothetical protein
MIGAVMRIFASAPLAPLLILAAMMWARAAEPPENVLDAVTDAEQQCRDVDGTPDSRAVLSASDVNEDGGEDWIADYAKLKCKGGINPMCGSGGCSLQIYLWDGATAWNLAFDETVQRYKFGKSQGKPVLTVTYAGAACDRPEARSCTIVYRLERGAIAPPP